MLEFIGSLLLTPGVPIRLVIAFPVMADPRRWDTIIISQRRVNVGFIFIGGKAMLGEATMTVAVPPASVTSVPFAEVSISSATHRSNPVIPETITVDGSAAETIQISGILA